MGNSSYVTYTKLSPHKRTRTKKISKITIHHAAVVNATLAGMGSGFSGSRVASANYGIDSNGHVGLYVEEKDRAITSCSTANDNVAVTIEVANAKGTPNWEISDKAYDALIKLCIDICKRNDIKKLEYTGDTSGNLTRHNMFTSTTCPGPYLQGKFPEIAKKVNEGLSAKEKTNDTYSLESFVRDVQKACGATVTGTATEKMLSKTVTLSAEKNRTHAAVKPVQKRLAALGYTQVGTADGVAGAKFTAAVKAFQKANGCTADGEITAGNKTWRKLLGV